MKSYIVRIYRDKKNGSGLLGTVEPIGADVKIAFTNHDGLCTILGLTANTDVRSAKKNSTRKRRGSTAG